VQALGFPYGRTLNIGRDTSFIESRGLEQLMPVRRLRLGGVQRLEAKGIALRLPEGLSDTSPYRSHVETDATQADVALRVDRVISPWTLGRLEQELIKTQTFEQVSSASNDSRTTRVNGAAMLLGRASGNARNGAEMAMAYAVIDLGREKMLARFVAPAEQVAFNEGVLRDSLTSVEAERLLAGDLEAVEKLEWHATSAERRVPVPVGWIVEAGAPSTCTGLANPRGAGTAIPIRDFTVAVRVAIWSSGVVPEEASAQCSSQRGSLGQASYSTRLDWLGVPYAIEGVFVRAGAQVLQLEVMGPEPRSTYTRALLAAWAKRVE
jgi:hypothetical protein